MGAGCRGKVCAVISAIIRKPRVAPNRFF